MVALELNRKMWRDLYVCISNEKKFDYITTGSIFDMETQRGRVRSRNKPVEILRGTYFSISSNKYTKAQQLSL